MIGCDIGTMFKVTIGGGSYQEGMTTHIQGVPPGIYITEEEIYSDLLLRKPGQDELTSPRREPDIPIIYSGVNAADTMPGFSNKGYTNGTPFVILIPNLDRHFVHIEQYQMTNRTPRPGHASYASYMKYDQWDDAIGAGIFSGRYTCTLVAAGAVAKRVLGMHGIQVTGYIKEAAGVRAKDMPITEIREKTAAFRTLRKEYDPIYSAFYGEKRLTPDMRFLEKMAVLADFEKIRDAAVARNMDKEAIRKEQGIHPLLNCPDVDAADAMYDRIVAIKEEGDSSGGVVEVVATGAPPGMGEPALRKLDGEIGRMLSIGAIKAVEIGAGLAVKDMKGSESNDQMCAKGGKVCFESNHAGGITGGLTTGQDIVARVVVKPTPTIAKDQKTIDKVTRENAVLSAITRRDPTIVSRIWPVAEALLSIILLDYYVQHLGYQALWRK
ncbi:MAG: chorismate synthase [Planctomycetes bacterium]|nr:chorismate synthase [Planctomycetota bacterium]